jgi:F-box domain
MMESFLSILPRGLFGLNNASDGSNTVRGSGYETPKPARLPPVEIKSIGGNTKNGNYCYEYCVFTTPNLVCTGLKRRNLDEEEAVSVEGNDDTVARPTKRLRGDDQCVTIGRTECPPSLVREQKLEPATKTKCHLDNLPEDVMAHCLSFVSGTEDRFALQCTSKSFQKLSNSDEMLFGIQVGGDRSTGKNGIIRDDDTPDSACDRLTQFAVAGNLEALYM